MAEQTHTIRIKAELDASQIGPGGQQGGGGGGGGVSEAAQQLQLQAANKQAAAASKQAAATDKMAVSLQQLGVQTQHMKNSIVATGLQLRMMMQVLDAVRAGFAAVLNVMSSLSDAMKLTRSTTNDINDTLNKTGKIFGNLNKSAEKLAHDFEALAEVTLEAAKHAESGTAAGPVVPGLRQRLGGDLLTSGGRLLHGDLKGAAASLNDFMGQLSGLKGFFSSFGRMLGAGSLYLSLSKLPDLMRQLEDAGEKAGTLGGAIRTLGEAFDAVKDPVGYASRKLKEAQDDAKKAADGLDDFNKRMKKSREVFAEAAYQQDVTGQRRFAKSAQDDASISLAKERAQQEIRRLEGLRDRLQAELATGLQNGRMIQNPEEVARQVERYNKQIGDQQQILETAISNERKLADTRKEAERKQQEETRRNQSFAETAQNLFDDLADTQFLESMTGLKKSYAKMDIPGLEAQRNINIFDRIPQYKKELEAAEAAIEQLRKQQGQMTTPEQQQAWTKALRIELNNRRTARADILLAEEHIAEIDRQLEQRRKPEKKEKANFQWEWAWQAPKALNSLAAMGGGLGENYRTPYEEDLDVIKRVLKLIEENTKKSEEAGLA